MTASPSPSPPPLPPRGGKSSGLMPVLVSALGYPGIGQFMQRRIVHGLVYSIGFSVFAVLMCVFAIPHVRYMLSAILGSDIGGADEVVRPPLRPLQLSAGTCLFFYLASLYDVWFAHHVRKRAEARP